MDISARFRHEMEGISPVKPALGFHCSLTNNSLIVDMLKDIQERLIRLEQKVDALWDAPGMPGCNQAFADSEIICVGKVLDISHKM